MLVSDCTAHASVCREEAHLGGERTAGRRGRSLSRPASRKRQGLARALCLSAVCTLSTRR
eukprot:1193980-Prorocentrum_minimum.AAC.1